MLGNASIVAGTHAACTVSYNVSLIPGRDRASSMQRLQSKALRRPPTACADDSTQRGRAQPIAEAELHFLDELQDADAHTTARGWSEIPTKLVDHLAASADAGVGKAFDPEQRLLFRQRPAQCGTDSCTEMIRLS